MKDILLVGACAVLVYHLAMNVLFGRLLRWWDWGWWYRHVYLNSTHWQIKRWQKKMSFVLQGKIIACEKCGSKKMLHVHHVSYKHLYHEPLYDLQIICGYCHRRGGGRI